MRAWLFTGAHEPLQLIERETPRPGPDEVVLKVRAAGLCHSDVSILDCTMPERLLGSVPQTLGHEVAGVVTTVGEGAGGFAVGDRVAFHMTAKGPGMGRPGGYAPVVVNDAELALQVPDGVGFPEAAAGTDAGMTSFHAVAVAGAVTSGTRVGVVGLGGLGFNGVQIALALGATVYAAEPRGQVHGRALDMGVTRVVSDVDELGELDLDVVIDFAGFGTTTAGALRVVRPGGRVVQVGLGLPEALISTSALVMKRLTLVGSGGGSLEDLAAYYELVVAGKVKPVVQTIGFDDIGEGIERVAAQQVEGRLVAVFGE